MPAQLLVDPTVTSASIIQVGGACYKNMGTSPMSPNTFAIDSTATGCDTCSPPSDCNYDPTGTVVNYSITTDHVMDNVVHVTVAKSLTMSGTVSLYHVPSWPYNAYQGTDSQTFPSGIPGGIGTYTMNFIFTIECSVNTGYIWKLTACAVFVTGDYQSSSGACCGSGPQPVLNAKTIGGDFTFNIATSSSLESVPPSTVNAVQYT